MDTARQLAVLKRVYSQHPSLDPHTGADVFPVPSAIKPEHLDALVKAGHFPNNFISPGHDQLIAELKYLAAFWDHRSAAGVFVAGLWSAPFLWQSVLTSWLLADKMPDHTQSPAPASTCLICGYQPVPVDPTLEWYDRMTIPATPLDAEPVGSMLALKDAATMDRPAPTEYDRWALQAVLTVLRAAGPMTRYNQLGRAIDRAAILPTTKAGAGKCLLETLALIGVLDTPEYPGFHTTFTDYVDRDRKAKRRDSVQAPLSFWSGRTGVNEDTVTGVFADFDTSSVDLDVRPVPFPPVGDTIVGSLERTHISRKQSRPRPQSAGDGPVEPGDVYAVRAHEDLWALVFCHEVTRTTRGRMARIEFYSQTFQVIPSDSEIPGSFALRHGARWQQWVTGLDRTSWIRRIARRVREPKTTHPQPARAGTAPARELPSAIYHLFNFD